MVCIERDNIIYCEVDNYYVVGDSSAGAGNGIKNPFISPSSITIIEKIYGKYIREIGVSSFANTKNIVNVTIKAKIIKNKLRCI